MKLLTQPLILFLSILIQISCGAQAVDSHFSGIIDYQNKTPCPGNQSGFFVCFSTSSHIKDPTTRNAIFIALTNLIPIVNSPAFLSEVTSSFSDGGTIRDRIVKANYIVEIEGYCDAGAGVSAIASVSGYKIKYNECFVKKNIYGEIDLPYLSGVLFHEILHNLGYGHAQFDPFRSSIPYYLGDLVEAKLRSPMAP